MVRAGARVVVCIRLLAHSGPRMNGKALLGSANAADSAEPGGDQCRQRQVGKLEDGHGQSIAPALPTHSGLLDEIPGWEWFSRP